MRDKVNKFLKSPKWQERDVVTRGTPPQHRHQQRDGEGYGGEGLVRTPCPEAQERRFAVKVQLDYK